MLDKLKREYKVAPLYKKLIYINIAVFILLVIPNSLVTLFTNSGLGVFYQDFFFAPAKPIKLLFRFWTSFTYMFTHVQLFHILGNMIVLYIGGRIYSEFLGEKRMLNTYILGGLAGFILFAISYNLIPYLTSNVDYSSLHGASAAAIAVVVASAFYAPDYRVILMLLGPVKYKYIAGVLIFMTFYNLGGESNRGGEISHIGGILWGLAYAYQLKNGKDIGAWFDKILERVSRIFKRKPKIRVDYRNENRVPKSDYEYNARKKKNSEKIDEILDKISKSGYDSLSAKEKEILFKASNKNE